MNLSAVSHGHGSVVRTLLALLTLTSIAVGSITGEIIDDRSVVLPQNGHDSNLVRYEAWIQRHGKSYKTEQEKQRRYAIFTDNVRLIDLHNARNLPYRLKENKFADLTNEEFRSIYFGYKGHLPHRRPDGRNATRYELDDGGTAARNATHDDLHDRDTRRSLPVSVDWRKKGVVTGVKDQGQCGCCWAFSAVAAIEGLHSLQSGKLISLSEQQLVDCDVGVDEGCNGGLMDDAFQYTRKTGGLTSESYYPYRGDDGTCNSKEASKHYATIKGYVDVAKNDEGALEDAVANRPVSVAVDAGSVSWQFYSSGIMDRDCGTQLNHGVTAVGYGQSSEAKYWIIKNSWGTGWGEAGYVRMRREVNDKHGLCGIAMDASYPV